MNSNIYVIHQLGDPYWEKLCPRSWIPAEAAGLASAASVSSGREANSFFGRARIRREKKKLEGEGRRGEGNANDSFSSPLLPTPMFFCVRPILARPEKRVCFSPTGNACYAGYRRPRAVLKTEGTVFPNTDRPRLVNNIFIFFYNTTKRRGNDPNILGL